MVEGVAGAVAYVAAVLVALRIFRTAAPPAVVTTTAVVVYVIVVPIAALGARVQFWALSAAYWFLVLSFLMVFGAIYKSISIRILLDLLERPDRREKYHAILERYVMRESYRNRVRILIIEGLATGGESGLRLTPKGWRLAAGVSCLQRLLNIADSG